MRLNLKKLLSKVLTALQPLCITEAGTGTITLTTGAVTTQITYVRRGWLVQTDADVKATSAVSSGGNLAFGTIAGIPKPISTVQTVTFYGDNAVVSQLTESGTLTARNCGDDSLSSGNNAGLRFVYITDGTML